MIFCFFKYKHSHPNDLHGNCAYPIATFMQLNSVLVGHEELLRLGLCYPLP